MTIRQLPLPAAWAFITIAIATIMVLLAVTMAVLYIANAEIIFTPTQFIDAAPWTVVTILLVYSSVIHDTREGNTHLSPWRGRETVTLFITYLVLIIVTPLEDMVTNPLLVCSKAAVGILTLPYFVALFLEPISLLKKQVKGNHTFTFKEKLRDACFTHYTGNTLYIHYFKHAWSIRIKGLCWPAMELSTLIDGDSSIIVRIDLILFGVTFTTNNLLWLSQDSFNASRLTGFYFGEDGCSFSLLEKGGLSDSAFNGWSYYLSWERLFKGKPVYTSTIVDCGMFTISVPAWRDYPQEDIELKVLLVHHVCTYRRWRPREWDSYNVVSVRDDVMQIPGKGENDWDCDDGYGIDISLGSTGSNYTPKEAAQHAVDCYMKTRYRRG